MKIKYFSNRWKRVFCKGILKYLTEHLLRTFFCFLRAFFFKVTISSVMWASIICRSCVMYDFFPSYTINRAHRLKLSCASRKYILFLWKWCTKLMVRFPVNDIDIVRGARWQLFHMFFMIYESRFSKILYEFRESWGNLKRFYSALVSISEMFMYSLWIIRKLPSAISGVEEDSWAFLMANDWKLLELSNHVQCMRVSQRNLSEHAI